jgi:regulatory protein
LTELAPGGIQASTPPERRSPSTGPRSTAADAAAKPRRDPTPLDVAARVLARRPCTEAELEARLTAMGYRPATAAATVARCRELHWVGDVDFARDRARALRARGHGPLRIHADLTGRGIDESLVDATIEESRDELPEAEWARRVLARARAEGPRAWRLLASRGFPEDVIVDVLGDAPE